MVKSCLQKVVYKVGGPAWKHPLASQDDSSEDDEDEIERYAKAKLVISNEEFVLQSWKEWSINYRR